MSVARRVTPSLTDRDPDAEARIADLLGDRLHLEVPGAETDLFETGLIDSLAFVELLLILESEYGVTVEIDDLDTSNFRTIRNIALFVQQHRLSDRAPSP